MLGVCLDLLKSVRFDCWDRRRVTEMDERLKKLADSMERVDSVESFTVGSVDDVSTFRTLPVQIRKPGRSIINPVVGPRVLYSLNGGYFCSWLDRFEWNQSFL